MKNMKIKIGLLSILVLWAAGLFGQQLRVSNFYIFNPKLLNPAAVGSFELNNFNISHQQRKISMAGWRSISQFMNFSGRPIGKKESFGWGANIMSDLEWTEFRLGISGSMSASLINSPSQRLAVGVSFGFINWGSNYDGVRVYDREDELIANRGNFAEVDAGMGFMYELKLDRIRGSLNGYGLQLPGNAISKTIPGLNVYPHMFIGGGIQFSPVYNIFVGPQVFYRDIFMRDTVTIGGSQLDIGLKGFLDRQAMWGGISYRPKKAQGTLAFGMRVKASDTVGNPQTVGYFIDLNAAFAFPLGETSVFGPTAEIGLNVLMGRRERASFRHDTVRISSGPFWASEGNLNDHMVKNLKPSGPPGLTGITRVSSNNKNVTLTYSFDDNSYQYVGNTPEKVDSLISELGPEWIGVDGFLEGMVLEVIEEALNPDTNGVANPEVLEPLSKLVSIELSSRLIVDETEAQKGAKGMMYEGELGTNSPGRDSLYIKVVYNDADTLLGIATDRGITNLELAALKLHAMRKKLEYELQQKYGDKWAILWEDDKSSNSDKIAGKKNVLFIKKPRIIPNNPHQDAFQVNSVTMRFARGNQAKAELAQENLSQREIRRRERRLRRQTSGQRIRDKVY